MRIVGLFDAAVPLALTVVDVVDDLLLDGTRQTGPVVGRTRPRRVNIAVSTVYLGSSAGK